MNKTGFLATVFALVASCVLTVSTNAQIVAFSNDFEDGDMAPEIGMATLVADSAVASVVPVADGGSEALGNNVLLLDQNLIDLDLTLDLTDTLSLTDGNTVSIEFDFAARRSFGVSRTIFVDSFDLSGNLVHRLVLGDNNAFGNGENDRQRPGYSTLADGNLTFGTPPGSFWWPADATPVDFVGQVAHLSVTIGASTFDFSTTSHRGPEFEATGLNNFDGTSTEIAEIVISSFGVIYGCYLDNIQVEGVVADVPDTLLGDVNRDEMVDFRDISPFIALLSNLEFQAEADINEDGSVDFRDIVPFIGVLSGGGA